MRTHASARRIGAVALLAAAAPALWWVGLAPAAPNLVANGELELPRQTAKARVSPTEDEVTFTIPGEDGFGRVVIRSPLNAPRIAQQAKIGYGQLGGGLRGLAIDTREVDVKGDWEISIWFDLKGQIRPNREYAYSIECRPIENNPLPKLEMLAPALWADGKFIGAQVELEWPTELKTVDDLPKRGVVKTPSFKYQTGGQALVLKLPTSYKGLLFIDRISLREIDEALLKGETSVMPAPARYVPIDDILEEQIQEVLIRTPEVLKAAQDAEGVWGGDSPEDRITFTSHILLALAERGEDLTEPAMQKAIKWLAEQESDSTEAVATRLKLFSRQRLFNHRQRIAADLNKLIAAQHEDGGWSSSCAAEAPKDRKNPPTNMQTFAAVDALLEAHYAGFQADLSMWRKAAGYFREAQAKDGGFRAALDRHGGLGEATTTFNTALGLCGLYITLDMSFAAGAKQCTQYLTNDAHIDGMNRAIEWLNNYYDEYYKKLPTLDAATNPIASAAAMTWLIRLSGISRLHDKDVFRTETEALIDTYDPNTGLLAGSLGASAAFLTIVNEGVAPVVFQRLILGGEDGHRFSRDADHLARYLTTQRKRATAWLETDIEESIRQLVSAPVLYVHAAGEVELSDEEWHKLRQYCFGGGVIFLNVAEDNAAAREALTVGLKKAFPEYSLKELPADDPIRTIKHKLPEMKGMQVLGNEVKNFVYLPADDWSCRLNTYQIDEHPETFQFFENLIEYTLDGEAPRNRFLPSTWSMPAAVVTERKVARIEVGGKTPVLPDLLNAYDRLMQSEYRLKLVPAGADEAGKVALLWVSCTGAAPLTAEEQKTLRDAMAGNALLFVETVSGNPSWAEAIRSELLKLDSGLRLRKLPLNHPVFTGQLYETFGYDVRTVPLRKALREEYKKLPRISVEVLEKGGQEIGFFTSYDLGSGVSHVMYPGCRGPMPEASRHFAANLMLYAMQRQLAQ